jgi:anti-anti-sigma regulatory factor
MSGFKITSKIDENMKTRLQIEGAMDEHSDYSPIETKFTDEVVFDFNNVEHINSTGIKHWVQWVTQIRENHPNLKFFFVNCPKPIVDQINMVEGFLPPSSVVKSFKVPFYCESCDKDMTSTFVLGREYDYDKASGKLILRIPDNTCDQAACEMEVDVVEQKYFRFLNKA